MTDKFKNKYRIESNRAQFWDYSAPGRYFITICTKNREHYFGNIIDGKMELSEIGVIANVMWCEIKNHAKNVELDAFVIMPNHLHGILILNGPVSDSDKNINTNNDNVETGHALSLQPLQQPSQQQMQQSTHQPNPFKTIGQKRFQNIGKNSISSIIGSYKSAVTKHANRLGFDFIWQSRFYDHIIRDDKSYQQIKQYIINNPKNWNADKFNPDSIL